MSKIPLTTVCPNYLSCNELSCSWVRASCRHRTLIDQDGDLFCDQGCSNPKKYYFIQEARFECKAANTYFRWESPDLLVTELGMVITGALSSGANVDLNFLQNLINNVRTKWKK